MHLDDKIRRLRDETPSCSQLVHFNNAGCSLSPRAVIKDVISHLKLEQEIGGYEAAAVAHAKIENFYSAFARLLNCDKDEIAFIENATRAWDMVFYSLPLQPGDRVITGQSEYASNYLALLQMQQRKGIELVVIPNKVLRCATLL